MEPRLISVFGSSTPMPDSDDYLRAWEVGNRLAQAGFAVATGGYTGTMAAVSQGAAEAGGLVYGVACERIELFRRGSGLNQWVGREVRYPSLEERVLHLVKDNQGMIALPGGVGTLSELALAWSFLQVNEMPARPLVLLGAFWRDFLAAFVRPDYIHESHLELVTLTDSPAEAVAYIHEHAAPAAG
ncbi:MAG: LOG family protein [Candidatus Promineifilaceae bacterium]